MTLNYDKPQRRAPSITEACSIIEPDPDPNFQDWWETHGQPYEAAVIEAGGIPWTQDQEKLAELRQRGLPVDATEMQARQWLFARRYPARDWELHIRVRAAA
jgi:hypothetical protein